MKPVSDFTTPRKLMEPISRHFFPVEQPEPFCCTTGLKKGSRLPVIAHFFSSGLGAGGATALATTGAGAIATGPATLAAGAAIFVVAGATLATAGAGLATGAAILTGAAAAFACCFGSGLETWVGGTTAGA